MKTRAGVPSLTSCIDATNKDRISTGYFISSDGSTSDQNNNSICSYSAYCRINHEDTIEMKLDLNQLKLSFTNNYEMFAFTNIDKTTYRAAISLYGTTKLTLTSYQVKINYSQCLNQ